MDGWDNARAGKPQHNPYCKGTWEYFEWEEGWKAGETAPPPQVTDKPTEDK